MNRGVRNTTESDNVQRLQWRQGHEVTKFNCFKRFSKVSFLLAKNSKYRVEQIQMIAFAQEGDIIYSSVE